VPGAASKIGANLLKKKAASMGGLLVCAKRAALT